MKKTIIIAAAVILGWQYCYSRQMTEFNSDAAKTEYSILWEKVCGVLGVAPSTVAKPRIKSVSRTMLELFGGGRAAPLIYLPGDNTIMVSGEVYSSQIAHEMAHAVIWQSPKFADKQDEYLPQWVEQQVGEG